MAPFPVIDDPSIKTQLESPATLHDVQYGAGSISSTLKVAIMVLAGFALVTAAMYLLFRNRKEPTLVWPATPLLVYESSVEIEFDDVENEDGSILDAEEYEGRTSLETILSSGTPRKLAFDVGSVMPFLGRRRLGILDRRGKLMLQCDTTAYYETDIIPTATKSPIDRMMCRPKVHFLENVATPLSPFWSRQAKITSPQQRPMFGFNPGNITPPVGSPMWSWKANARTITEHPDRLRGIRTP
jgi:hypothetical protein